MLRCHRWHVWLHLTPFRGELCKVGWVGMVLRNIECSFPFTCSLCRVSVGTERASMHKRICSYIFRSVSLKLVFKSEIKYLQKRQKVVFYSLHSFLIGMYLTDLTYINTLHPFTGGLDTERTLKVWFALLVYGYFVYGHGHKWISIAFFQFSFIATVINY